LIDRPPGERARHVDDVLLRVAAVNAEGVQLHQLAPVVLVEAAARTLLVLHPHHHLSPPARGDAALGIDAALRIDALPVVEIEQHRRALRRRAEQIAELSEHARTDRVPLVLGDVLLRRALVGEDVEVVEPEVGHDFFELPLGVRRAKDFLRREVDEYRALLSRQPHLLAF